MTPKGHQFAHVKDRYENICYRMLGWAAETRAAQAQGEPLGGIAAAGLFAVAGRFAPKQTADSPESSPPRAPE